MATIIKFESKVKEMNYIQTCADELPDNWSAEIIIFPGIRIERHAAGYSVKAEISQG